MHTGLQATSAAEGIAGSQEGDADVPVLHLLKGNIP
jgi:hypothetical protein